jgi:glycine cleavage system H protein
MRFWHSRGSKTVSDLFLPLAGEILMMLLRRNSESVNSDPYGAGWMVKVRISNVEEIETLLSSDSYKEIGA